MDKPMQLLVLILNKTECLDQLFEELLSIGIKGATVVESTGMARVIGDQSHDLFGSIRMLIDTDRESNLTIFMAVNESLVEKTRQVINEAVGGLENPDTAVLFGLPINFFDGKTQKS